MGTEQRHEVEIIDVQPAHADALLVQSSVFGAPEAGKLSPHEYGMVSVQRVQNYPLKQRFELERADMTRERGYAGERFLFHGSGRTPPALLAKDRDGFMVERSGEGRF